MRTGDRELVLARLRRGTATPPPANHAHPHPGPDPRAPEPRSVLLDAGDELHEVFAATAAAAGCGVHRSVEDVLAALDGHGVATAVATDEPAAAAVVDALRARGIDVGPAADRDAAAAADVGVTSCRAAVASTGSVAVASDVPGARWASLLPRVHVCVVERAAVVPSPGSVLRGLARPLPAHLSFVSGPSRTGDIEQILTRGVHGPVAVEILLVG